MENGLKPEEPMKNGDAPGNINLQVEPNDQGEIDLSAPMEEKQDTPHEIEQEERKAFIKGLIDKQWPDKNLETYLLLIAKRYNINIEELNSEDRGEANNAYRDYMVRKEAVISAISQTDVPENQIEEYLETTMAIARMLSEDNKIDNPGELKYYIKISESLDRAIVMKNITDTWYNKFLATASHERIKSDDPWGLPSAYSRRTGQLLAFFSQITEVNITPRNPIPSAKEIEALFKPWLEASEFSYSISENFDSNFENKWRACFKSLITYTKDENNILRAFKIIRRAANEDEDTLEKLSEVVRSYGSHQDLSDEAVDGFITNVLPAIKQKDPRIQILLRRGNIWGMKRGDFGVGDFLVHCLVKKINPLNINEMLMASREIPATNQSRLEQNRSDALALVNFGGLRKFIHNQRPGVHDVVSAMVKYYDDPEHNPTMLKEAISGTTMDDSETVFDISNYNEIQSVIVDGQKRNSASIDILRRLAKNTELIGENPPQISSTNIYSSLNRLYTELKQGQSAKNVLGETEAIRNIRFALGESLHIVNKELQRLMESEAVGIDPDMIMTINWLEQKAFEVLQKLNYDDQLNAHNALWFKSLIVFEELTHALKYDPKGLQIFIETVSHTGPGLLPYKLVSARLLDQIKDLAEKYKSSGKSHLLGSLWSGNVAHELMSLAGEWRSPNERSVPAAQKHYQERISGRTSD